MELWRTLDEDKQVKKTFISVCVCVCVCTWKKKRYSLAYNSAIPFLAIYLQEKWVHVSNQKTHVQECS